MPELSPATKKFVVHWGEMGTRWGVNRTVAQIHALLFAEREPLSAEQIADALIVARSNVSTSLRELLGWGLIKVVHVLGDRRDYFEPIKDPWEMFRVILNERKRREIDPTLQALREFVAESAGRRSRDRHAHERMLELLNFFETMDAWYNDIVALPTSKAKRFVKLGRRIGKLL